MKFTKEEIDLYSDVVCGTIDIAIKELVRKYEKSIFKKKYYKDKLNDLYKLQHEKYLNIENKLNVKKE